MKVENTNIEKWFTIEASYIDETNLAWHLDCEGDHRWFAKSQVQFDKEKEELKAPAWILKNEFPNENWD